MKLCCKCLNELFDRDTICPICKSDVFIDDETLKRIKSEIMSANKRKINSLLKYPEYQCVYDYIQKKSNYKRPDVLELSNDKNVEVAPSLFKKEQNTETTNNIPKCPTCGSTDLRKINIAERGVSIFALGLLSKKINKTFECENCGYTW